MIRKIVIILIALSTVLLSSCSVCGLKQSDNDQSIANTRMTKVLETIRKKDKDALKAMFSKESIAESKQFNESIAELFDYFKGSFISYNDWNALNVDQGHNDDGTGRNWKCMYSTYDVVTSEQKYRFSIQDFTVDTANPDNVGICSLYILKWKMIPINNLLIVGMVSIHQELTSI